MHRLIHKALLAVALLTGTASLAQAQTTPFRLGDVIPASTAFTDSSGKAHTLAEFRGKPVVLEWNNPGCPFVHKHYDGGAMPKLQKTYTSKGVTWLTVNSAAEGKQGYLTTATAADEIKKLGVASTLYVLDSSGALGKAFGAETTPHMFVLNGAGKLVYMGAIDSIPSFNKDHIEKADNYVAKALDAVLAGTNVSPAQTNPYGCSVKY